MIYGSYHRPMGRKKVANPKQAKTVSLPKYLWENIDLHANNRSYYIERCITRHMNTVLECESFDVRKMTNDMIAGILVSRISDGGEEQLKLCAEIIKAKHAGLLDV